MTRSYRTMAEIDPVRFREALLQGDELAGDAITSEFSGLMRPIPRPLRATQRPEPRPSDASFLEAIARHIGASSDNPQAVAESLVPQRRPRELPDLSVWENLRPLQGPERPAPTRTSGGEGTATPTIEAMIDDILVQEGGFQQWTNDRGNYVGDRLIGTNRGVTPAALAEYRGVSPNSITVEDIQGVTEEEARDIFRQQYYYRYHIDELPEELQANVFDMAVNSGSNSIRILQRMLGVEDDGSFGPITREALSNAEITNNMYADARERFYRGIVARDATQAGFLNGWLNRARSFRN